MSKHSKKTRTQDFGSLASAFEAPRPSEAKVSDAAFEAALQAVLGSDVFKELAFAKEQHKQAEELRTQIRTLGKKQEEDRKALSIAQREKIILEQKADKIVGERVAIRTDLKTRLLGNPAITALRAAFQGKFREAFEDLIKSGLAEDEKYAQLEADAAGIEKNAAKVMRTIAKTEKAIAAAEKKITRLQAEAARLDEAAWKVEGIAPATSTERK